MYASHTCPPPPPIPPQKAAEGNGCRFVWQGSALEPAFKGFRTLEVDSEASAVGVLRGAGCEHFWSLAKELKDED